MQLSLTSVAPAATCSLNDSTLPWLAHARVYNNLFVCHDSRTTKLVCRLARAEVQAHIQACDAPATSGIQTFGRLANFKKVSLFRIWLGEKAEPLELLLRVVRTLSPACPPDYVRNVQIRGISNQRSNVKRLQEGLVAGGVER